MGFHQHFKRLVSKHDLAYFPSQELPYPACAATYIKYITLSSQSRQGDQFFRFFRRDEFLIKWGKEIEMVKFSCQFFLQ